MKTILIVEDDKSIRTNLAKLLTLKGYHVLEADSFACYQEIVSKNAVDLYLLDVYLPDGSGFDICADIRTISTAVIIFITSCDDEESIVKGLDLGGDDYITKPFRAAELISRIQANLRRIKVESNNSDTIVFHKDTIDKYFGNLIINTSKHQIKTKQGEELSLTATEFRLLELLIANAGLIVKRQMLLERLWDDKGVFVEDNTLTVVMSRLKSKLGMYGKENKPYIETIRGVGYRWIV